MSKSTKQIILFLVVAVVLVSVFLADQDKKKALKAGNAVNISSEIDRFLQEWNYQWRALVATENGTRQHEEASSAYERWVRENVVFQALESGEGLDRWLEERKPLGKEVKAEKCVVSQRYDADDKKRKEQEVIDFKDAAYFIPTSFMVKCQLALSSPIGVVVLEQNPPMYDLELAFDLKGSAIAQYPSSGFFKNDLIEFDGFLYCENNFKFDCAVGVTRFILKPNT